MAHETFSQILQRYKRHDKSLEYTHTSLIPPCMALHIPDEELNYFQNAYIQAFKKNETLGIVEKHKNTSPVLIDLDFKLPLDVDEQHVLTFYGKTMTSFISNICRILADLVF